MSSYNLNNGFSFYNSHSKTVDAMKATKINPTLSNDIQNNLKAVQQRLDLNSGFLDVHF